MPKRIELVVRGRVQGVSFRYHARDRASALGLCGFVRNSRDGSVELVAEGDPRAIDELLCWASTGPPHARVDEVEAREAPSTGELNGFIIAPTI